MTKGKFTGVIRSYKKDFAKRSVALTSFSIDEIKSNIHNIVNDIIKKINEREISNNTLEKNLICIDKKKVKGENRNEEMKKIIITYVLEKYREIMKTNKKRDMIPLAEQIFSINAIWSIKISKKGNGSYY